jgi:excinuclease UvrABC nuclease subunit
MTSRGFILQKFLPRSKKSKKTIHYSLLEEIRHGEEIHLPEEPRGEIVKSLEREMKKAVKELNFELAAKIRDRIRAAESET